MSKFESILSDAEIVDIVSGLAWSSADTLGFGKEVAEHIQQAVLARLHEQEPLAWYVNNDITFDQQTADSWKKNLFIVKPLYENPSPSIVRDKTACISEKAESETQESAPFTPKTVSEMRSFIGMHFDSLQYANPETEEPDEMDRYTLTIHDLLSAFDWAGHYDCDHIVDNNKMVTPLAQRKIQSLLDKGEYRSIENATVLVNDRGHAAIVNRGGAFYWVDNEALAREYDGRAAPVDIASDMCAALPSPLLRTRIKREVGKT